MSHNKTASITQQIWLWATALLVIGVDQVTKWRIEANYSLGEATYPIEGLSHIFRLIHVANRGAAFGTLQGFGWFFSIVAFIVTGYLLYLNYSTPGNHKLFRVTLGIIMGGALGNVIDRFRLGHVTDFIHFNLRPLVANYPALDFQILDWPVFNWADTSIFTGVVLLGVLMWTHRLPEDLAEIPTDEGDQPAPTPARMNIKAYAPLMRHPEEVDDDIDRWLVPRFGARALAILASGMVLWLFSLGIAWWWQRRGHSRHANNHPA